MSDGFQSYVRDILTDLLERAREAKARKSTSPTDGGERDFAQGRALAYYEVISYLVNQLDALASTARPSESSRLTMPTATCCSSRVGIVA